MYRKTQYWRKMLIDVLRRRFIKTRTFENLKKTHQELVDVARASTGSKSEYFQDLWIIANTNSMKNGFFVEFGATDGIGASNTWLLEKKYGWQGILAEPSRTNFRSLNRNRNCIKDPRAVWDKTGERLLFSEREENYLSSVKENSNGGAVRDEYYVESISLNDLLIEHKAPIKIDYISVDIEGSELRVLKKFLSETKFEVEYFTIEHNWRKDKKDLILLMQSHNYVCVMENLSYRDLFFMKSEF
jgi:FkbM family methyltransferase